MYNVHDFLLLRIVECRNHAQLPSCPVAHPGANGKDNDKDSRSYQRCQLVISYAFLEPCHSVTLSLLCGWLAYADGLVVGRCPKGMAYQKRLEVSGPSNAREIFTYLQYYWNGSSTQQVGPPLYSRPSIRPVTILTKHPYPWTRHVANNASRFPRGRRPVPRKETSPFFPMRLACNLLRLALVSCP